MKYKLLILDLDGTTVASSKDSLPSEAVRRAVAQAKQCAIVAIATGRPFYFCKNVLDSLSITSPCVLNGGAEILDMKTGKTLFTKYLSIESQKAAFEICENFNLEVATSKDQYREAVDDENDLTVPVAKLFVGSIDTKKAIAVVQELESVEGIAAHLTTSWTKGDVVDIHITDSQATKKHGIEELLKILKISKAETIGIGDYHNDLPLLESVGLKIAMGSAPEELKAVADHVVPDLKNDGVAVAIEKFILN